MAGSGVEAAMLGNPDLGYITLTEAAMQARNIANTVSVPVLADCDTGYGSSLNVIRTVREFEMNGVAAVSIEDQTDLRRPPSIGGVSVIPRAQFVGKIKAAVDARRDPDLVIIARVEAYESMGFNEVVDRANACVDVGADMVFIGGVRMLTPEERVSAPKLIRAPMIGGGDVKTVEADGYKLVLSGSIQSVVVKTLMEYLPEVRKRGGEIGLKDRAQSAKDFDAFMGLRDTIRLAVDRYNEPALPGKQD
jgi:2-methylisocitrate lyase-like PEP mutase family enzyme